MKILRSILVGAIILAVMLSSFSSANVDDKRKENGLDAIVYLMGELNVQDPQMISAIYGCGWFDYVFKIRIGNNGGEETYRVTKQDANHPWEYKSVQMNSHTVVEGKNMTIFDEWDSEAIDWLFMELKNMNSSTAEVDNEETPYQPLRKGSKGTEVVKLQNRLNELGYSVGKADGDFGNKTKVAVEQFQADNGLEVTGIADDKTQELLYSEDAKGKATETTADSEKNGIDPEILEAGIEFVSDMALEQTAQLWNMSKSALWVGEVYCEDKGNNVYHFGARVYRDGSDKGMGFGEGIAFKKDGSGHWTGKADNQIAVYSLNSNIPGELVWSSKQTNDNSSENQTGETDEASLIASGMKYISNAVMDIAPALLGVSKEQCKITEIYYLDKGNHEYQFTARVSRGGPGGFGIGKDLTITAKTGGDYDIVDNNHVTLYSGSDKIPGELILGDSEQASIARGMQILGNELGKLDANGDGELSMDEIFEMN